MRSRDWSSNGCSSDLAAGHRIALGVVGQGQQHIHIVTQFVVARRGNKNAPLHKKGNVGRVQGGLFLDGQLHAAGTGRGGSSVERREGKVCGSPCTSRWSSYH